MTASLFDLSGKRALITGGGSGLGLSMARAFIHSGSEVIITGRTEHKLQDAVEELGHRASYIVNDVSDLSSLPGLADQIENEAGPVDILVNNSGINMKKPLFEVTDDEFQQIMQTNLNGSFALTREVSRKMAERERGSIIMITSMAAIYGIPDVNAYTASKTAVLGLVRSLAVDLSPMGIRVNAIAPGFIDTPMLRRAFDSDPERKKRVLQRTPLRKLGQPEDVASAALFLASDASRFITGVNLPVDGGNAIGF